MTNIQNAKLNMYNVVIAICNENTNTISEIPALKSACDSFIETVASITGIAQKESKIISGFATSKSSVRKALASKTVDIASNIFAYSFTAGNEKLTEQVTLTVTNLSRRADEDFISICSNISDIVDANLVPLEPFNVTADTLKDLNALLTRFRSEVSQPRIAISERAGHKEELKGLFKTAGTTLKNRLDKIVITMRVLYPGFVSTYISGRQLVNHRTTFTQIKGTITNALSNAALEDATIFIEETTITTSSGKKGLYTMKPVPSGIHSVTATKVGYNEVTITDQIIKLGKVTTIDIALTPFQEK